MLGIRTLHSLIHPCVVHRGLSSGCGGGGHPHSQDSGLGQEVESLDDTDPVAKHAATFTDGVYSVGFLFG